MSNYSHNNFEFIACILGLKLEHHYNANYIVLKGDSKVVLNSLSTTFKL